jgi:putative transposase
MIAFIDDHRDVYGVEPICKVLPIAPSTYHAHAARRADPDRRPARAKRDRVLAAEIRRCSRRELPGLRRAQGLAAAAREGFDVARCTVARLMRAMGLQGVIRGKPCDHGERQGGAPARSTASTASSRRRAERALGLGLHLCRHLGGLRLRGLRHRRLRPAHRRLAGEPDGACRLRARCAGAGAARARPVEGGGLVHHSDRGVQYVSIKYTERLAEAGIEPSVGSVGDSYDNALAETINGLYKAEVIHRRGPWRSVEAVEFATLEWVDWFNNRRLLEPIGNIPPAEAEARYYAQSTELAMAA